VQRRRSNGIEIALLGGVRLFRDGEPVTGFRYDKVRALLALLVTERNQLHRREWLASLLWPELESSDGRRNLRIALAQLNKMLPLADGRSLFVADKNHIGLDPGAACLLDLEFLEQAPTSCRNDADAALLAQALARYQGPFLGDFALPDTPEFDAWLNNRREATQRRALAIAEALSDHHRKQQEHDRALGYAERAVALAPHNEACQRRLIELLAAAGHHGAALAQYQSCERLLAEELGVAPEPQTIALKERLAALHADGAATPKEPNGPIAASTPDSELRQVTILYCELALTDEEDLELLTERLAAAHTGAAALVRRHGGHLVSQGGELLAYFGYPTASEHAALNALDAAMAVITALAGAGIDARAALHSGPILTGTLSQQPDPAGVATRITRRLGRCAANGEVVMSGQSHALLGSFVRSAPLEPLQELELKRPMAVFRLLGRSGATDRTHLASEALTPLIGRERELAQITALWEEVAASGGRTLLIRADAGIGKSRLVRTFCEGLAPGTTVHRLQCDPQQTATPFSPLLRRIAQLAGIRPTDSSKRQQQALQGYLDRHPAVEAGAMSLLAPLLGLPEAPGRAAPQRPAQRLRHDLETLLLELLTHDEGASPRLIVLEDLHWADPSTLSFVERLLATAPARPLLTLFTSRPPLGPPWPTLDLAPLSRSETRAMIAATHRHQRQPLDRATASRIAAMSDGVPLYVEEMARMMADGLPAETIPATLQDLLAARLETARELRPIAQMAGTIGREFPTELLAALLLQTPGELEQGLERLCATGLLQRLGEGRFQFRHALLQEAAYRSQTRSARTAAHRDLAHLLQHRYPLLVAQEPQLLAHHLTGAGELEAAVAYWCHAARHALARAANAETIAHTEAGLALLAQLPAAERAASELALRIEQGTALLALTGYGSREVATVFNRAHALLTHDTDPQQRFRVLWGLWMGASSQSGYNQAHTLAEALHTLATQIDQPTFRAAGHYAMGNSLFWLARFAEAGHHLEAVVTLGDRLAHPATILLFGESPVVTSLAFLGWVRWFLGDPVQAVSASEHALTLARELGHPHSLGYALTFGTVLHRLRRDAPRTAELAVELLALADEHQLALWSATGATLLGWAQAHSGDAAGLALIRHALEGIRAAMVSVSVPILVPLIEGCMTHGLYDQALTLLDECDQAVTTLADRHYTAELARLRGRALIATGANSELACSYYHQAAELAHAQGAPLFELRALQELVNNPRHPLAAQASERIRAILAQLPAGAAEEFKARH
jgi:DNA-binding SARP family transcriptional activator